MQPDHLRVPNNPGHFFLTGLKRFLLASLVQPVRLLLIVGLVFPVLATGAGEKTSSPNLDAATMARSVMIHRDRYGVPHIEGPTDESAVFGFAYCQAEDYLWQVEESSAARGSAKKSMLARFVVRAEGE